jgi:ribosomal protein S18 acetylase RimI-like enzyme
VNIVLVSSITLELANEEDAEILSDISKRAFHSDFEVGAPNKEGGPPGYDSAEFQFKIFMKWLDYYKILLSSKIVGGLMVEKKKPRHYECQRIFVDPDYHNQGIATKAFEIAWKIYADAKIWTLGTPEWNVRTKHFYEKLGFVQVGWTMEAEWRGRYYEKIMDASQPYVRMKVSELEAGMKDVEIAAKVQEISESRNVRSKDGKQLKVAEATISDGTGSIKLALWNDQIEQIKFNDKIRIYKAFVTSFRGQNQLNVGKYDPLVILL